MKIESGTGNGYYAKVSPDNKLEVAAINLPRQHFLSKTQQKAFQVIGEATVANGTVNVLHINNDTADQTFAVTYIRIDTIGLAGGTALPNAANYFELGTGLEYSSGGTATSSVNMYLGSTTTSGGFFYESDPTLTGTMAVFDKHYPTDASEERYGKEGALIIPPGGQMTVRYTGDNTSGTAYARVSYYASPVNSLG